MTERAAIIMAAGKGTRMKDPTKPKVMYEIMGKPMIHYVVDLAFDLNLDRVLVIVGHQRESVSKYLAHSHPRAECVTQPEQLGTGHAIMQAKRSLEGFKGMVIVLSGDVPLLTRSSVEALIQHHKRANAGATILTVELPDPTGYGRILRNADGSVRSIVEQRDASPAELKVTEINSGIYVFNKESLFDGLEHIGSHNVQHEYYLTDVFEYYWRHRLTVSALKAERPDELRGINTFEQLEEARKIMEIRGEGGLLSRRALS
jgi:UDP-N-acetylglucosamine pyrophosphorylase